MREKRQESVDTMKKREEHSVFEIQQTRGAIPTVLLISYFIYELGMTKPTR